VARKSAPNKITLIRRGQVMYLRVSGCGFEILITLGT
jgi:hypothetical protein